MDRIFAGVLPQEVFDKAPQCLIWQLFWLQYPGRKLAAPDILKLEETNHGLLISMIKTRETLTTRQEHVSVRGSESYWLSTSNGQIDQVDLKRCKLSRISIF